MYVHYAFTFQRIGEIVGTFVVGQLGDTYVFVFFLRKDIFESYIRVRKRKKKKVLQNKASIF